MTAPALGRVVINNHAYIRPVIRVAVVTIDGTSCTVPLKDLADLIDDENEYTVQVKTMSVSRFERLPEFGGW